MIQIDTKAPTFTLDSVQGSPIRLADYQNHSNVLLWFSRGFTCPFCRAYMAQLQSAYNDFRGKQTEILQIGPNAVSRARQYFRTYQLFFPYLCDPDKRLYSVYGMADQGPIQAQKNTAAVMRFSAASGQSDETRRAVAVDMLNSSFIQRLQHHALTAVEQGLFLIDKQGIVRWSKTLGPLENLPDNQTLLDTISRICPVRSTESEFHAPLAHIA